MRHHSGVHLILINKPRCWMMAQRHICNITLRHVLNLRATDNQSATFPVILSTRNNGRIYTPYSKYRFIIEKKVIFPERAAVSGWASVDDSEMLMIVLQGLEHESTTLRPLKPILKVVISLF